MKTKKLISILLCMIMLVLTFSSSFSALSVDAKLYDFYGNNMLFEQNKQAVFSGRASKNSTISVNVINSQSQSIATGEAVADENGRFEVKFSAPNGSYEEYTAVLSQDGNAFRTITGIVFGELWLASGQSNMEFSIASDISRENFKENGLDNQWVRVLQMDTYMGLENSDKQTPVDPQENILGARWRKGTEFEILEVTSVGYFFARALQEKLDMPVGILNCSCGASTIQTWLSREAVESDSYAKGILQRDGFYIAYDEWDEKSSQTFPGDFTSNYNARVAPLHSFNISGMIWYQGEGDMEKSKDGEYIYFLDMLQKINAENFGYDGEKLPIVCTMLATFDYNGYEGHRELQNFNSDLALFQKQDPKTRATISIYDIPISYEWEYHLIHPTNKKPVGERMSTFALNLVYGKNTACGVAAFDSSRIESDSIYVTFSNVYDGLTVKGDSIRGFALCGSDGVYYKADAEIVSKDTVKVTSKYVSNPVSATYAYYFYNNSANLFSSFNGEPWLAVSPLVTDKNYQKNLFCDYDFAYCENDEFWKYARNDQNNPKNVAGNYDIFDTALCKAETKEESAFKGNKGLNVRSISSVFTLTQKFEKYNIKEKEEFYFTSMDNDFSKYGAMSFMVRNNGRTSITVNNLIYSNSKWYSASINGNGATEFVIPADGKWYEIELNFSNVYENNRGEAINEKEVLNNIEKFELTFENGGIISNIDIDSFEFKNEAKLTNNTIEKKSVFQMILHFIKALFNVFVRLGF